MTAFSGDTFHTHTPGATTQIKALRQAIQDNHRKLDEVRQQRQSAEEYLLPCSGDHMQSLNLIRKNGEIVELLQDLDNLLQEESHLSDLLDGEASRSSHHEHVQKMIDCMVAKARSLTLEILEVKQHLAETKARFHTAQEMSKEAPTSKSKKKQRLPK